MSQPEDLTLPSDDAQLHRVRRRLILGALVGLAAVGLGAWGAATTTVTTIAAAALCALVATLLLATTRNHRRASGGEGQLRLTGEAVELRREGATVLRLDRAAITEGWIERHGDRADRLVLEAPGVAIHAAIDREDPVARALLDALGLDARALRMTVDATAGQTRVIAAASLYFTIFLAIPTAIASFLSSPSLFGPWVLAIALVGIILGINALSATRLTIGEEGVEVRRRRRSRLLRFEHVAGIERDGSDVTVTLNDAPEEIIVCATPGMAHAVTTRLMDAVRAWRSAAMATHVDELDRGEATHDGWRDRMKALLQQPEDYRHRTIGPELLWDVVNNPAATPERRVGATLALAEGASDTDRAKLRIAAARCAHPSLRIALEEAAEGELEAEALEEAMKSYEEA